MTTCPECHKPLPPDARTHGLCPRCLLTHVLASLENAAHPRNALLPSMQEIANDLPQFELLEFLGQGGMGVVYKARQKSLDRLVALKVFRLDAAQDPAFLERFEHEARVLASLSHPNIVAAYEFARSPRFAVLVMEFVPGPNLRTLLHRGKIPPTLACNIAASIAEALAHAHDATGGGIIHRDIKPENILLHLAPDDPDPLGPNTRIRVADFGLAKLLNTLDPLDDLALTSPHERLGTAAYMAPEQRQPQTPAAPSIDPRADLYALGVILYELLTGELPLGRFPPPSQSVPIPRRLDRLVMQCLEKDPNRRPPNARAFLTALRSAAKPNAHRKLLAAALVILIAAAITSLLILHPFSKIENQNSKIENPSPATQIAAANPPKLPPALPDTQPLPQQTPVVIPNQPTHFTPPHPFPSLSDPLEKMKEQHGADRIIHIFIDDLPGDVTSFITARIDKIRGSGSTLIIPGTHNLTLHIAPATNVKAFADQIDFGTVTSIDETTHTLRIKADPAKLPKPLPPAVTDPADPNFYQQNLDDLASWDHHRRTDAIRRLKTAPPSQLKLEITNALLANLNDPDKNLRHEVLATLAPWAGKDSLPTLTKYFQDPDAGTRRAATAALKSLGPIAEPALLQLLADPALTDASLRIEAVKLLKSCGTENAIPTLEPLTTSPDFFLKHAATDTLTTLRQQKPKPTTQP